MKKPVLLDAELLPMESLEPSALSVNVNVDPLTTASMTVPKGATVPGVFDWVELFGPDGTFGLFRVSACNTTYAQNTVVTLEHGLTTLQDDTTAALCIGHNWNNTEKTGTLRELVEMVLGCQSVQRWTLGAIPESTYSYTVDFQSVNLLAALSKIVKAHEMDLRIITDQTAAPWTVSIVEAETVPSCECRINRNMESVRVDVNTAALYTRVICPVLDAPVQDEEAAARYGVRTYFYNMISSVDKAEARRVVQKFLENHKKPVLSISIDAQQLAAVTAEPMDRLTVGKMCRVAMPEFGDVFTERIVSANYANLVKTPEAVTITLSTQKPDAVEIMAQAAASRSMGGADGLGNTGGGGPSVDSYRVRSGLSAAQKDLDQKSITIKAIDDELTDARQRLSYAGITLDGPSSSVTLLATKALVDTQGSKLTSALLRLDAAEGDIKMKVAIGELNSSITLSGDGVSIQGGKITLDGKTVADHISAQLFTGRTITGVKDISTIGITGDTAGFITGSFQTLTAGGKTCAPHKLTIGSKNCDFFAPDDATFDFSDTDEYAAAVSEGKNSVSILSVGQRYAPDLSGKKYTLYILATASNGRYMDKEIELDASEVWQDGYDAGSEGGGIVERDIQLDDFQWYPSSSQSQVASYTNLSTLASIINNNQQGYATFCAVVKGVRKYYRIAVN